MQIEQHETKLKLVKTLGKGAFGMVFHMKKTKSQNSLAVKKSFRISNRLSREFIILDQLKGCPHII